MSSQRKLIRYKIFQMLTGITGVETIHLNRTRKIYPEEMPALLIYTRTEEAELYSDGSPRVYRRTLRVGIEVITDTKDDQFSPDDVVDDICAEIEQRIFQDEFLSDLAVDTRLSDTDLETSSNGETNHAAARITFEVMYDTDAPEEQTDLDDFERVHSEMIPEGAIEDDTEPAVDDVEVGEP